MPESPQFSESSFAFGFVENLINGGKLRGAKPPVFLSTAVEGKSGGHFDVRISTAPVAFLIQFKIPTVLKRGSGLANGSSLNRPFYRMELRAARGYAQHLGLCAWEAQGENVYYVSPRFDSEDRFQQHYQSREIPDNSAFFRPSAIQLPDFTSKHSVVYDRFGQQWETRSEPVTGKGPISWPSFNEQVGVAIEKAPEISTERFLYVLAQKLANATTAGYKRAYEIMHPKLGAEEWEEQHFDPEWRSRPMTAAKEAAAIARVSLGSEIVIFGR